MDNPSAAMRGSMQQQHDEAIPASLLSSPTPAVILNPANGSTATLPQGKETTPHKRSKNPFNFLKRKGSSVFKDSNSSPTANLPNSSPGSLFVQGHARGASSSHSLFHSHSPDLRSHADLPHAPSTLSLASTSGGSFSTVLGGGGGGGGHMDYGSVNASPKTTFVHAFPPPTGSASGSGNQAGSSSSGSALQPPFSLSSMYNRLHHHGSFSNSGGTGSSSSTSNQAAGAAPGSNSNPASGTGTTTSSPHTASGRHQTPTSHPFLLHLGVGHHHHHLHSSYNYSAGNNSQSAIGLEEEHLLEPEQLAAQAPPGSKSSGGGGVTSSLRPGRLRLGRPRTRDKDSAAAAAAAASGSFGPTSYSGAPAGGTGGSQDDDLNAFAAALGERYGGADGAATGSAGGAAGTSAFPFGHVTPSAEIDFSLDTNFDQIDDIVDPEAARRAALAGIMPDIHGSEGGAGGVGGGVGGPAGYFGGEGVEDVGFMNAVTGVGGALPLPKPLPSQLQSAADDKEAAERERAARRSQSRDGGGVGAGSRRVSTRTSNGAGGSAAGGSASSSGIGLSLSPRGSLGGPMHHHPLRRVDSSATANTGSGGFQSGRDSGSSAGTSAMPGPGGYARVSPGVPAGPPSAHLLEARGRSSSVSFLEAAGMGMGGGETSLSRLGRFSAGGNGRSLGSIGDSSLDGRSASTAANQSVAGSERSSNAGLGVAAGVPVQSSGGSLASAGMPSSSNSSAAAAAAGVGGAVGPQHPKLLRLHSGPTISSTTSAASFGYGAGQVGNYAGGAGTGASGMRPGMRRVSMADGPSPVSSRYGKSEMSALAGSLGSVYDRPGSSITTAASTGLDSRSSADTSSLSPGSMHPKSLSTASAPPGSMQFERSTGGSMPLESLRELDGARASGAGADALERNRMAQVLALRKGSSTSAGSRRSGISPKSSYAMLPGTSRDVIPAEIADPSYTFPARMSSVGQHDSSSGSLQDALGLRKASAAASSSACGMSATQSQSAASTAASASSAQTSTAWMAPDSWAVQPDISKGLGADDDSEESETDGPSTAGPSGVSGKFDWSGQHGAAGRRRRSSSAVSSYMIGTATVGGGDGDRSRSGTADGSLQAPPSFFGEGRWGQRKDSAGTEPGYVGTGSSRRPSDIEIIDTNSTMMDGDGMIGPDQVACSSPTSVFLQQKRSQSSLGGGPGGGGGGVGIKSADYAPSMYSPHSTAAPAHSYGRGGGGAASVSTGAAAVAVAAAGKFLHRPHKLKAARPSTAGSLHSTFRATALNASPITSGGANANSNVANNANDTSGSVLLNAGGEGGIVNNPSSGGGTTMAQNGSSSNNNNNFGPRPSSSHRPSVGGSSEDDNLTYIPQIPREREASGSIGRRPTTAMSQGGISFTGSFRQQQGYCVRIHRTDGPPFTILCPLYATAAEIRAIIAKKFGTSGAGGAYRLFVRDKGSERPLGPSEKPALIQKRRLEQAGYNETDGLESMGRTDLSYLLRFVYRLDSVPTFDSESFGNDEHTFQHLQLQGRNLEMVPIFLYRQADWIVSLDLSGNPMSDVPLDFIQACTNLRSIRLSNLALKRVPQSLRHSETLTYIDVSNNRIPDLSHIALDSAAELLSFKIQNNRLSELPSYFARIETLRYLNISNNRFETFPMVLCDMTFLVDLDVSFNAISVLPPEIGRMVSLQRLALVGNALEALPDTVADMASLESIDVRRNMLQDVSVLFRLPNLQSLQMSHNNLKNVDAEFGQRLRSLDFGQNQLTKARIVVPAASELTVLNLSSADIDKFDDSLFSQLPNLTDLVLDRNRQFSDLTESVGELKSLVRLSCNNTRLAKLPDAIGKLSKLRSLEVHNNNIKVVPASIWNCGELEYINVSANIVQSFPFPPVTTGSIDAGDATKSIVPAAISTASPTVQQERKGSGASFTNINAVNAAPLSVSLKKLRLCDNRLTDEVFNIVARFVCLEVLNLSFNEIYEVPAGRLSKNLRLQELYLSGNNLSSIPAEDIAQLRDLETLYINGNKLQTLPAELGQLRKLVNLDVGNNNLKYNIANWNYDWNWNSNLELRFLNLSGNKRLEIKYKTEVVNGRQKNISDFSRLSNLRLLGLMDVTFTVQSIPDESDNRRLRTSLSQINEMAYGIADTLGKHDSLSIVDVVIPQFRKKSNECLFGLFAGRGHGSLVGSRIANHLAEWVGPRVEWELQRLLTSGESKGMSDVLRRAFLRINKELADMLMSEGLRQDSEIARVDDGKPALSVASGSSARHHWCAGASAVLAYMVDKILYVANAGDALAVISRNRGDAHLISTKHDPSSRDEATRIRSAEGWVSLRGYVNDKVDVSRSFGYYHMFPIINAAPALHMIELTDSDEFIILANRTLWDYMSYQTAVDVARMERDDPMLAAQKLRDFAISFGAEESIMVMVISVADLFSDRQQRRAATNDLGLDKYERPRFRRDLPGDRVLARLPMEIPAPIGQLALVFTDIKNSTSLWETNPGMHAAIRLHTSLMRRQLHIIGGYEVKTEGDAFMVSFPTIASAMHWCFTIQLQLLREDWPQEILDCEDGKEVFDSTGELIYRGLSVRMGIHWGAPVCELDPVSNRMDYFGPIVNRAARISGAADGGQIMASKDVVTELKAVLDSLDEASEAGADVEGAMNSYRLLQPGVNRDVVQLRRLGFGISEVGERKLKGLETPEMLYLVYPTALAGRQEAKPDAPAPQVFEPTVQLLNIDEVKRLGLLCLRLEALSSGHVFPGIGEFVPIEAAISAADPIGDELSDGRLLSARPSMDDKEDTQMQNSAHTLIPLTCTASSGAGEPQDPETRRKVVEAALTLHPELLVYALRDDATDEEMARILEQLTTRVHNALSSIILRRVAGSQGLGFDAFAHQLLASLIST